MNNLERKAFAIINQKKQKALNSVAIATKTLRNDATYLSLEEKRDGLRFEIARLKAMGIEVTQELTFELKEMEEKLNKRMAELGYKEEDLKEKFSCKICRDNGVVGGETCKCVSQLKIKLLSEESGSVTESGKSFSKALKDLKNLASNDHQICYAKMQEFCKVFPNNSAKIVGIIGAVGSGKSFLSSIVANALTEKGYSVLMINSQVMNNIFLKYHLAPIQAKDEIFEPLIEAELLIIDDLGTENIINNVTIDYFYTLLNLRHNKSILFTTNNSIENLAARYDQRIISRLVHKERSLYLELNGEDLRL